MEEYILISKKVSDFIMPPLGKKDKIIFVFDLENEIKKITQKKGNFICVLLFLSDDEWDRSNDLLNNCDNIEYRGIIICPTGNLNIYPSSLLNIIDLRNTAISSAEFQFLSERAFFHMKKRHMLYDESIELTELKDSYHDQELLVAIGRSLTHQKNPDELLRSVLTISKKITGADGGTIYFVEKIGNGKKILKFKKSHTFSRDLPYEKLAMELNMDSIAGYVALTGNVLNFDDVYKISEKRFPGIIHNFKFDKNYRYKTKSMLIVPMKNHLNEITGVFQLVNCKENLESGQWTGDEAFTVKLKTNEDFENKVFSFDRRYESLMESIASQTAIALENIKMIEQIEDQFEEFVKASISAVESRDPSTYGHSFRVAELCVEIARAINKETSGVFKGVNFTESQIKELKFAALLHDFGKVNIDNRILLKSKKLFPKDFTFLQLKLDYLYRCIQFRQYQKKSEEEKNQYKKTDDQLKRIERIKELIEELNEPDIPMRQAKTLFSQIIEEVNCLECFDLQGNKIEIIDEIERMNLAIQKGSLNYQERHEVESHVAYTYNFVSQIPWPGDLKNIPEIAYKHHEFLDGSGYPQKLAGKENIPIQSRIMTIADIFDALTAADRPYKTAVSMKQAVKILEEEADNNKIDRDILDVFIKYKIYRKTKKTG